MARFQHETRTDNNYSENGYLIGSLFSDTVVSASVRPDGKESQAGLPDSFFGDRLHAQPIFADVPGGSGTTVSLTVGGRINGAIEVRNDHDWYRVTLEAGKTYTFSHSCGDDRRRQRGHDATLRNVRRPARTNDDFGGTLFSSITFTAGSSGTYYIDVGAYNRGTGNYSVALTSSGGGGGTPGIDPGTGLPIFTNDQIARQLTHDFWGGSSRSFNVDPGGT